MINAPSFTPAQPKSNNGDVKTSIFYMNDIHSQISRLSRLKTAADTFTTSRPHDQVDCFKVTAGDMMLGKDPKKASTIAGILNHFGLDVSTIGNHEFDMGVTNLAKTIAKSSYKFLTTNLNIDKNSPLNQVQGNKLVRSTVIEKNGNKYGFIGAQPIDLTLRTAKDADLTGVTVDDLEQTTKEIAEEVQKLKQQGVNKIIMLSHLGNDKEVKLAQKVDGIDVIIGGHSHDLIKGVTTGQNYVMSPSGEPVVITQAGRDGNYFGILDLVFDKDGRIKSVTNNVTSTNNVSKNLVVNYFADQALGKAEQIGFVNSVKNLPEDVLVAENPIANFMADAMRKKAGTEIALINSANMRGSLCPGIITTNDIADLEPFKNSIAKVNLSEKDLIDGLNMCAKSINAPKHKPGIMQVSGLKYTITPEGNVKDVYLKKDDGQLIKLNHENPSPTKTFTAVYDSFVMGGGDGITPFKKDESEILEKYNWTKADAMQEFILAQKGKPIDLDIDGRITVLK